MLLLVMCYLGINNSTKGTSASTNSSATCPSGYERIYYNAYYVIHSSNAREAIGDYCCPTQTVDVSGGQYDIAYIYNKMYCFNKRPAIKNTKGEAIETSLQPSLIKSEGGNQGCSSYITITSEEYDSNVSALSSEEKEEYYDNQCKTQLGSGWDYYDDTNYTGIWCQTSYKKCSVLAKNTVENTVTYNATFYGLDGKQIGNTEKCEVAIGETSCTLTKSAISSSNGWGTNASCTNGETTLTLTGDTKFYACKKNVITVDFQEDGYFMLDDESEKISISISSLSETSLHQECDLEKEGVNGYCYVYSPGFETPVGYKFLGWGYILDGTDYTAKCSKPSEILPVVNGKVSAGNTSNKKYKYYPCLESTGRYVAVIADAGEGYISYVEGVNVNDNTKTYVQSCPIFGDITECYVAGVVEATLSGHTFKGWGTEEGCTNGKLLSEYKVSENTTFHACYIKDSSQPSSSNTGNTCGESNYGTWTQSTCDAYPGYQYGKCYLWDYTNNCCNILNEVCSGAGTGGGFSSGLPTSSLSSSSSYITPSEPVQEPDTNPDYNPQTGNIAVFVVLVIALLSIVYSIWYFRKVKEN